METRRPAVEEIDDPEDDPIKGLLIGGALSLVIWAIVAVVVVILVHG